MPDNPQPRRRITDKDRRQWSDARLNDLKDDVEDVQSEQRAIAALYRQLAPLPELLEQYMKTTDRRLDKIDNALEKLTDEQRRAFERNFTEHRQVKATADEIAEKASTIAQNVKPTSMSKVRDFVTYVSVLIVPFLLTYLTYVLAHGGSQ